MKPEALEELKKLAEYIERSCDEWFITYPNKGDSDMAFQRMLNFKMDIHKILALLGELDNHAGTLPGTTAPDPPPEAFPSDAYTVPSRGGIPPAPPSAASGFVSHPGLC